VPSELPVPLGRRVHLPGRGTTFVREVDGPPGAPTLILVHGWIASGGLNWFTTIPALAQHFRLIVPDLRGHGRGIRSRRRFRLSDCADDIAALAGVLGIDRAIVVGYSLGGPVAQLLWRRHPDLVDGLVLAATGDCFVDRTRDRVVFTSMMMAAAGVVGAAGYALAIPATGRRIPRITRDAGRARTLQRWAMEEMARHDWRTVFSAGRALGSFDARSWISGIDVPTAVLVTMDDAAIPAAGQLAFASRIPAATVHPIDAGHTACTTPEFAIPLVHACRSVAGRIAGRLPVRSGVTAG
jgi:pimeloyl-ACP methyl ester carboxylesterase